MEFFIRTHFVVFTRNKVVVYKKRAQNVCVFMIFIDVLSCKSGLNKCD